MSRSAGPSAVHWSSRRCSRPRACSRGSWFDNDIAFMNDVVVPWCRFEKIEVTQSRAYKKNDQAFVEQKNGAVVRLLVGYGRFEGVETAGVRPPVRSRTPACELLPAVVQSEGEVARRGQGDQAQSPAGDTLRADAGPSQGQQDHQEADLSGRARQKWLVTAPGTRFSPGDRRRVQCSLWRRRSIAHPGRKIVVERCNTSTSADGRSSPSRIGSTRLVPPPRYLVPTSTPARTAVARS